MSETDSKPECGYCGGTGEVACSSTSYMACPECLARKMNVATGAVTPQATRCPTCQSHTKSEHWCVNKNHSLPGRVSATDCATCADMWHVTPAEPEGATPPVNTEQAWEYLQGKDVTNLDIERVGKEKVTLVELLAEFANGVILGLEPEGATPTPARIFTAHEMAQRLASVVGIDRWTVMLAEWLDSYVSRWKADEEIRAGEPEGAETAPITEVKSIRDWIIERGQHPDDVIGGETLHDLLWAFWVFNDDERKARGRQG